MKNWEEVFSSGVLDKLDQKCVCIADLAKAVEEQTGYPATMDGLRNAFNRHRDRQGLKEKLGDYLKPGHGGEIREKRRVMRPEDYRFAFSDERWDELEEKSIYVVTSAMNNAKVDQDFWNALQRYCRHRDAMLIVVPSRYRNPTSPTENAKAKKDAWWPDEVQDYMTDEHIELHEKLDLMAHVRVQATAVHPLSGLDALSKGNSAIFGHAQVAMQLVPTPQNKLAKMLHTTGSVSVRNYSDTKAGIKGEFHHTLAALVVERDGPRFHVRQLIADKNRGFYDLDRYYHAKGHRKAERAEALVLGDVQERFVDPSVLKATFHGEDSIAGVVKPKKLVHHDLIDSYSISHHSRKDPVSKLARYESNAWSLEDELKSVLKYLDDVCPTDCENIVVSSNHCDHLLRWMKEVHAPVDEPWNARVWLELWEDLIDTVKMTKNGVQHDDPVAKWVGKRVSSSTRFLSRDDEEDICGVLVGLHGDRGVNGARGSVKQFAKLGAKTVTGHSHVPAICHGAYVVGTSSYLRLEYNSGPSSWAQAHCIIHANGKRQIVFVVDGRWRKNEG